MSYPPLLVWIKSEEVFLKLIEGDGDNNLLPEDIEQGLTAYILWSTFEIDRDSLEIDEEMEVHFVDSGELDLKKRTPLKKALSDVYEMAFNKRFSKDDIVYIKGSKRPKEELQNNDTED